MEITIQNTGRRFNRDWIFREINYQFTTQNSYAVLGPNGAGKSTLMQLLSGSLSPSEGSISYHSNEQEIAVEDIFSHIAYAAPYIELIEELTLQEMIDFHFQFKPLLQNTNIIQLLAFEKYAHKYIRVFSSGMKQRLKLALAFCSDTPILLLDEPTANLDEQGIELYHSMLKQFTTNRLVIVASNQLHEYDWCTHQVSITDYK